MNDIQRAFSILGYIGFAVQEYARQSGGYSGNEWAEIMQTRPHFKPRMYEPPAILRDGTTACATCTNSNHLSFCMGSGCYWDHFIGH